MAIDTAQVTSRSNTDLLRVERALSDRSRPAESRMSDVLRIAREWEAAIDGSVPAAAMKREAIRR